MPAALLGFGNQRQNGHHEYDETNNCVDMPFFHYLTLGVKGPERFPYPAL